MATQFQNAFSDNALKNLVILLALAAPLSSEERGTQVALAGALFALPFILFSMGGGSLADRFSKQRVIERVKVAEIGIMLFASLGLGLRSLPLQMAAIFLMGCHSAVFGPSKYGILPEILPPERLSWGNGILELLTFLGIILGTLFGGLFAAWFREMPAVSGACLVVLAAMGWMSSRGIPRVPAGGAERPMRWNPVSALGRQLAAMRLDRDLWRANWGNAVFFFIAALVQMNLVLFAHEVLRLGERENAFLNAALALGIGLGSVCAGYLSKGGIAYGLVPVGSVVMALGSLGMGLPGVELAPFSGALMGMGFGAGLYIVPIAAVLQKRPAADCKGAVQGAASLLSFIGIFCASGVQRLLRPVLEPGEFFWGCGGVAVAIGAYVAWSRRSELFGKREPGGVNEMGDRDQASR
jgi:acyl-[acyl-carrier-protein]-phospholipid O-acyltransferase/long-chain-fatty-acid--[acyl-carrier-protein] ligase